MTGDDQPRTLLAVLVAQSDRTHEEHVADFNKRAGKMGESATLSLRQFDRWLAGDLRTLPRPTCRRVAEAPWGRPIQELLGPPPGAAGLEIVPSAAAAMTSGMGICGEEGDMERRTLLRRVLAGTALGLAEPALNLVERVRRSM